MDVPVAVLGNGEAEIASLRIDAHGQGAGWGLVERVGEAGDAGGVALSVQRQLDLPSGEPAVVRQGLHQRRRWRRGLVSDFAGGVDPRAGAAGRIAQARSPVIALARL